jgi:hypothetical protein
MGMDGWDWATVWFIHRLRVARDMAKTDSFFIRKTVNIGRTNAYAEDSIDLGAYVDALGKSVLRIHNCQVTYSDNTGRSSEIAPNDGAVAQFQLVTQSQTDIVLPSDKSLISSGRIHMYQSGPSPDLAWNVSEGNDINLQEWTNGFLVGVEQIYLGGSANTAFEGNVYVTVVLECTVETLSSAAAMALALSQQ